MISMGNQNKLTLQKTAGIQLYQKEKKKKKKREMYNQSKMLLLLEKYTCFQICGHHTGRH